MIPPQIILSSEEEILAQRRGGAEMSSENPRNLLALSGMRGMETISTTLIQSLCASAALRENSESGSWVRFTQQATLLSGGAEPGFGREFNRVSPRGFTLVFTFGRIMHRNKGLPPAHCTLLYRCAL